MMQWRPISELTDEEFERAGMYRILMVWNDCNGPHHFSWANEPVFSADDLRRQPWTHFLILPEEPSANDLTGDGTLVSSS